MKREDLQKIEGLSKEQIDSIMNLHQNDVETWQSKISTLQTDKTNLETKLDEFKGVDISGLQAKITTLEKDKSTLEQEKSDMETKHKDAMSKLLLNAELDKVIYKSNTIDPIALKSHLNIEQISYDDESKSIKGFDEQLETIKKDYGYLFTPVNTGKEHLGLNGSEGSISLHSSLEEKYK